MHITFTALTIKGGYTALSTKGVASLLSISLWRALTFPVFYLLLLILTVSALAQIRYLNRALQRFDSTQVIPTQFVLFTLSVIIGSAVLFRDFESATPDQFGKFFGGCALTFLGVYLITSGRERSNFGQGQDMSGGQEETIGLIDEELGRSGSEDVGSEEDQTRRRSKAGTAYDGAHPLKKPRRSSKQQTNGLSSLPQTPRRRESHESSIKSPAMENNEETEAPLLHNPWQSSEDIFGSATRPGMLENANSSPLLPSETQRPGPQSYQNQALQHPSPPRVDRTSSLSRRSKSRMLPGPLISPLSSPLSAIVADSLRRGVDTSGSRRRPGPSTLGRSRSERSAGEHDSGERPAFDSSPLKGAQPPDDPTSSSPASKERSQSVGATLGQFFKMKRDRSKGKDPSGTADTSSGSPEP